MNKVRDVDRGFNALKEMAAQLQRERPRVLVGLVGSQAMQAHRGGGGTVVDIAYRHEMGIGVPKRSFIAATLDAKQGEYRTYILKAFKANVLYHVKAQKKWSAKDSVALKRLGLKVQGDIKSRIMSGIQPPLSARTLKLKGEGKTTPLIDTGHMLSSLTFVVRTQ
jgi:hypothetical protein